MNRREFIAGSAGLIGTASPLVGRAQSAPPCPLPTLSAGGPTVSTSCSGTELSKVASSIPVGGSSVFSAGVNTVQSIGTLELQWTSASAYWDSIRRELQYIVKPHQVNAHAHYVYSEASGRWRETNAKAVFGEAINHPWNHAMDPATGDYYFFVQSSAPLYRYSRANDSWSIIATVPSEYAGQVGSFAGMGWHPNLFGRDDGGLVIHTWRHFIAWRKASNSFVPMMGPFGSGQQFYLNSGGGDSVYFPESDELVLGTGRENFSQGGGPASLVRFMAGSGGTLHTGPAILNQPPMLVWGAGSGPASKIVKHPRDSSKIVLLEKSDSGGARWWISADRGSSWNLQSGTHPFSNGWRQWTCGSIPEYGVVWGVYSGHDGGGAQARLWKPA